MMNVADFGSVSPFKLNYDHAYDLMSYDGAEFIRHATCAEYVASVRAARRDGGAGIITVAGIRCYVIESGR